MIPYLQVYLLFAFICAAPWIMNWACAGSVPVTARLVSMFGFAWMLVDSCWLLWRVHIDSPSRMNEARNLLAPIIAISVPGLFLVTRSLVKRVHDSMKQVP